MGGCNMIVVVRLCVCCVLCGGGISSDGYDSGENNDEQLHTLKNSKFQTTEPHHITPRNTTQQHTTPHHITPHNTTPHNTTRHHTTPHHTTKTTQHNTTPHQNITPHNTKTHHNTPHHTTQTTQANTTQTHHKLTKTPYRGCSIREDNLGDHNW